LREILLVVVALVLMMVLVAEIPTQLVDSRGIVSEYCIEQIHVELDSLPRRAVVYARLYLDSIIGRLKRPHIPELSMSGFSNEVEEDLSHKGILINITSWIGISHDGSVNRSLNQAFAGDECEYCMCVEINLNVTARHSLARVGGHRGFHIRVCHPFRYRAFLEVENLLPKNRSVTITREFSSPEEATVWIRSTESKGIRSTITKLEGIEGRAREMGIDFSYSCKTRSFTRVFRLGDGDLILGKVSVSCEESPFQRIVLYTARGGRPHVVRFVYRTDVDLLLISYVEG